MNNPTVQIIEDEPLHASLVDRALRLAHFDTSVATDGQAGWQEIQRRPPSLILLDLMLPGLSGQDICRMVRQTTSTQHIPIIMLTAIGGEAERIAGLEMGADDYVVKPFSPREVVLRVRAVLRRIRESVPELRPDSNAAVRVQGPYFAVSLGKGELSLSRRELTLLSVLLRHENALLGAEELTDFQAGERPGETLQELDRDVRRLHRKIENSGAGSIDVLPGYRYRLRSRR